MEVKLNPKEAQAVLALLARTTIQGNEAETIVMLKQKITQQLQATPQQEQTPVEKQKK